MLGAEYPSGAGTPQKRRKIKEWEFLAEEAGQSFPPDAGIPRAKTKVCVRARCAYLQVGLGAPGDFPVLIRFSLGDCFWPSRGLTIVTQFTAEKDIQVHPTFTFYRQLYGGFKEAK